MIHFVECNVNAGVRVMGGAFVRLCVGLTERPRTVAVCSDSRAINNPIFLFTKLFVAFLFYSKC